MKESEEEMPPYAHSPSSSSHITIDSALEGGEGEQWMEWELCFTYPNNLTCGWRGAGEEGERKEERGLVTCWAMGLPFHAFHD